MPVDRTRHKSYLQNILIDIYTTAELRNRLAFKGGTCLMLFHDLDRFSTDLDFNCLSEHFNYEAINTLLKENYPELQYSFHNKHHTYFWLISYGKSQDNIKIEIRKPEFTSPRDTYEIKDLNGVSIRVMTTDCMLAHKLCAATDRRQNRDIYDIWFMLSRGFTINREIVEQENTYKKGISLKGYLQYLLEHLPEVLKSGYVLDDIGNLLYTQAQKDRVRATLWSKLAMLLQAEIEKLG